MISFDDMYNYTIAKRTVNAYEAKYVYLSKLYKLLLFIGLGVGIFFWYFVIKLVELFAKYFWSLL